MNNELQNVFRDARPGRRQFFQITGLAALGVAGLSSLTACVGDSGNGATPSDKLDDVSLTMFVWAAAQGAVPRERVASYIKTHPGVKVTFIEGTNSETFPKLVASLEINKNKPLLNLGFFNGQSFAQGKDKGLWEPIDESVVPNVGKVLPEYRSPDGLGAYLVMDAMGIVYNKNLIPNPPESWMDLFDPKYKGKVGTWDAPAFSVNGLPVISKLNGGSESNMDPGIKIFSDAAKRGQFLGLFSSNDQLRQQLSSEQLAIAPGFQGVALPWMEAGDPIGFAVPKEGVMAVPEGFQLVKGSSKAQLKASSQIMNEMFSPEAASAYSEKTGTIPLVEGAELAAKFKDKPSYQLKTVQSAIQIDWAKLAAATAKYTDLWNTQVKANL
jgi:putative spermidine/putrescine transport system substrate-binding protein